MIFSGSLPRRIARSFSKSLFWLLRQHWIQVWPPLYALKPRWLFPKIVTEPPPLPPIPPQAELIREAAWSEADEALGRALQDTGRLLRSFERLEFVVDGEAANHTRRAKGASDLVLQWVRQAARQRTITPLGSVGDKVPYDPVFHDLGDGDAAPGEVVRLVKPPIVRGTDDQRVVLIRGEVELD